jgi:hypothetical protein
MSNPVKPTPPFEPQKEIGQFTTPGLPTVFTYFSIISPFLVVLLFVFISIINSNLKGMIYLLGIFILLVVVYLFQSVLRVHLPEKSSPFCQIFAFPMGFYTVPSMNSAIFLFTLVYLFLPMVMNNIMNYPLLIILLILYAIDCVIKTGRQCTTPTGIILGSFVGILVGLFWYFVIKSQSPSLLYYDDLLSNKIACSRPSQQKFKCSVYKNGELLQTL